MNVTAPPASEIVTDPRRQRRILIAMCTALVAVVGSVSILNLAQQDLAVDLGASQSDLLWIINGFTTALAALLLPVGAVGDRWGRKPLLLSGLGLFVGANAAAAAAGSVEVLLAARIMAGVAAAMIMPVTLSVITSSFPPDRRARAVGVWTGFAGGGGLLGLFVSSYLIDNVTWPWLFAMPVLFAALSLLLTLTSVGNSREHQTGRFDTAGSVLSAVGIGALVFGIHEGPGRGWTDPLSFTALLVGALALASFAVWELRQERPLLQLRLFARRGLAAGSVTLLFLFAVMFGVFVVLLQFMQAVLGYSALTSVTGLMPWALTMMVLSGVAPMIAARVGTRRLLVIGVSVFGAGLALLAAMTSASGGYWSILPGLVFIGVGMGLAMSPSTTAITEALPPSEQGVASALNDVMRELGSAIGIALFGSLVSAGYRSTVSDATTTLSPDLAHRVEEGIGSAFGAANELGPDAPDVLNAARAALVDGWRMSMWFAVALAAATLAYLLVRGPRPRGDTAHHLDTEPAQLEPVVIS